MEGINKFSGIPDEYRGCDISQYQKNHVVFEWVRNHDGFLFINGSTGTGKTHMMCTIKKRCNEIGLSCKLVFCSDLFLKIRSTFGNSDTSEMDIVFNLSPDPDVVSGKNFVIFDDVGTQKISEYVKEIWQAIIDRRYRWNYKTIFTSNFTLDELSGILGDRIASRLASGHIYEMNSDDLRVKDIDKRDLTKIF